MSNVKADITTSLRVVNMSPLDTKSLFQTVEEMIDLGEDNSNAFTYYDGMASYCLETRTLYRWQEVTFGSTGLLPANYIYPPNTIVSDVDYSGKSYNFIIDQQGTSNAASSAMFFVEPSVNIEIKDTPTLLTEAFHFGSLDIGSGVQDYMLVKNSFVSQSNYPILTNARIGDEIKVYNVTNNTYLGHFVVTGTVYSGYRVLTTIEKGDWDLQLVFNIQTIAINVLIESLYSISLAGNIITLKKGTTTLGNVDLSGLLTASTATITSGVLNVNTGIVTFTLSDASTFDVDFSGLINADDFIDKDGNIAVKNKDIYQNLFVEKSVNLNVGVGFYSADLQTNYNSVNFAGYPYPTNRDYIVLLYSGARYLLIKKNDFAFRRLFMDSNTILGLTFYKFRDNVKKSMQFLAYTKILTRKTDLPNLNAAYYAFPIFETLNAQIPFSVSTGAFDELPMKQLNEADGRCIITHIANESIPLRKDVTAPYTVKDSDHDRILHVSGAGAITIPKLNYGFECGFVQASSDANNITFTNGSGVTLLKPANKQAELQGQYYTAYIMPNEIYTAGGVLPLETVSFILSGDLKSV